MTDRERSLKLDDLDRVERDANQLPRRESTISEQLTQPQALEEIRSKVHGAIRASAPQEPDELSPSDTLTDDLNFDSLGLVELAVKLEGEFDLRAFQDSIEDAKIDTVGDIEALIVRLVSERAS